MRRLTSRQNPLVSRCRAAARGALDGALLVDGAHLVSDALDAGVRIREAIVAADAGDRAELRALVDRLCRAGVDVMSATSAVMDAASPVRSPSAIVALADRPVRSADAVYQGAPPFV